jgi:ribosome-associated protein
MTNPSTSTTPTWDRLLVCAEAALGRKAADLVVLDVGSVSSIADYFLICSGRSDTQVQAIADAVDEAARAHGDRPLAIEGREHGQWVLIDYGDVIVHVFYAPVRAFYDLERLWSRATRVELPHDLALAAAAERTGTGDE